MASEKLTIVASTWNLGNKECHEPPQPNDFSWLADLCVTNEPSLVMLGLQEVHPSHVSLISAAVLKALSDSALPVRFRELCAEAEKAYAPLLVFEKEEKRKMDSETGKVDEENSKIDRAAEVKSLYFSYDKKNISSKSAISAYLKRYGIDLCLTNAHLEAGHSKLLSRNEMQSKIEESFEASHQSLLLLVGDLNYRIEGQKGFGSIMEPTKAKRDACANFDTEFEELVNLFETSSDFDHVFPSRCQLRQAMAEGSVFKGFEEAPLSFLPTYKRSPTPKGEDALNSRSLSFDRDERRLPGWCDRILWRRGSNIQVDASDYGSIESAVFSDHRPVHVVLRVSVKQSQTS
eukprot:TRINITY_DN23580_c1_g1_i1.p1 TRINITY_DN23580_c1_g1~~TRINITY_DN23580_c1_g1_i1.p1  ORF type:complete len:347 (-),score=59.50 TRINITY_DN23580_c1_g1_i1:51-1091(-)